MARKCTFGDVIRGWVSSEPRSTSRRTKPVRRTAAELDAEDTANEKRARSFKKGDRVREYGAHGAVQEGTVVGSPSRSKRDIGSRVPVRWDDGTTERVLGMNLQKMNPRRRKNGALSRYAAGVRSQAKKQVEKHKRVAKKAAGVGKKVAKKAQAARARGRQLSFPLGEARTRRLVAAAIPGAGEAFSTIDEMTKRANRRRRNPPSTARWVKSESWGDWHLVNARGKVLLRIDVGEIDKNNGELYDEVDGNFIASGPVSKLKTRGKKYLKEKSEALVGWLTGQAPKKRRAKVTTKAGGPRLSRNPKRKATKRRRKAPIRRKAAPVRRNHHLPVGTRVRYREVPRARGSKFKTTKAVGVVKRQLAGDRYVVEIGHGQTVVDGRRLQKVNPRRADIDPDQLSEHDVLTGYGPDIDAWERLDGRDADYDWYHDTEHKRPSVERARRRISEDRHDLFGYRKAPSKGTRIQSLIFDKKHFTVRTAHQWALAHGFKATKADVQKNTIRVRQLDPSEVTVVGTITLRPGVKATVAK